MTRRGAAWLALALALLLAQALGHWHRVAHALPVASVHGHDCDHDHGHGHHHDHDHDHGHPFGGHAAGDAECRLLDQLSQADGLAWALPLLPTHGVAPCPSVAALNEARLMPAWRLRARGPPRA